MIWLWTMLAVFVVSVISLIGVFFISMRNDTLRKIIFILVSLAVGGLFGDAFIHLIPEAFEKNPASLKAPLLIICGIMIFFILEKFLRWRHEHIVDEHDCEHTHHKIEPMGYMNLIADGVHNIIDGMLIAAAFSVNIKIGISTTIAVVLHEIPHEIGNFGVLISAGFSKARALAMNFLSASASFLGAAAVLIAGNMFDGLATAIVPLTAGGFIYIAGSDLVPELHKENNLIRSILQFISILAGIAMMMLLTLLE